MKPRIRPVKNLFHRWGLLINASPEVCAEALEGAGLIELSSDRQFYTETPKALDLDPDRFDTVMLGAIIKYQSEHKGDLK